MFKNYRTIVYYGDFNNFNVDAFRGLSTNFNYTISQGSASGYGINIAENGKKSGEFLIGISVSYGVGYGSTVTSELLTWQVTQFWKNK